MLSFKQLHSFFYKKIFIFHLEILFFYLCDCIHVSKFLNKKNDFEGKF